MGVLATQLAHDIKSPLSVLTKLNRIEDPKEQSQLLHLAVNRIQNISDTLLRKYRSEEEDFKEIRPVLLVPLVENIISEKQFSCNLKGADLKLTVLNNLCSVFVRANAVELGRALSNIIDNAIDAIDKTEARIMVAIGESQNYKGQIEIAILDNGKGIPSEIIPSLAQKSVSYDKPSGTGLGLYHAKQTIEAAEGSLTIESTLKSFTSVSLTLLICSQPEWFADSLQLEAGAPAIVLDDDQSIHELWNSRLTGYEIQSLAKYDEECLAALAQKPNAFFFVDQQLSHDGPSGLDIIEKHQLQNRAFLVTSYYDDPKIQDRAMRVGCRILPKQLIATFVVEEIEGKSGPPDLTLIDDSSLMRYSWAMVARQTQKKLLTFNSRESFLRARIPKHVPVYIDYDLGNGKTGFQLARELFELGYSELNISTGFKPSHLGEKPQFIKSILGKEFPA